MCAFIRVRLWLRRHQGRRGRRSLGKIPLLSGGVLRARPGEVQGLRPLSARRPGRQLPCRNVPRSECGGVDQRDCTCRLETVNSASIDPPDWIVNRWCPIHGSGEDPDHAWEAKRDDRRSSGRPPTTRTITDDHAIRSRPYLLDAIHGRLRLHLLVHDPRANGQDRHGRRAPTGRSASHPGARRRRAPFQPFGNYSMAPVIRADRENHEPARGRRHHGRHWLPDLHGRRHRGARRLHTSASPLA